MRRLQHALALVWIAVAICLLAAPCGQAADKKDTLTIVGAMKIETTDPYFAPQKEVVNLAPSFSDALLWIRPGTTGYEPLLAKSWRYVDPVTLEFKLRPGVKFHNGEVCDADDVVYTFSWVIDPNSRITRKDRFAYFKQAIKIDQYTVRVVFKRSTPLAPLMCGSVVILPKDYHSQMDPKKFGLQPVYVGPYKVSEFTPGGNLILTRNETYYKDSPKGRPAIGKIVFRAIPEDQTRIAELVAGHVDWIANVPLEEIDYLRKAPKIKVASPMSVRFAGLMLDAAGRSGDTPMKDVRVRRAIAHAINREAIAQNLMPGEPMPIHSPCSALQFGCPENKDVVQYKYNPEMAKKLLAEAGYGNGFKVDLTAYHKELSAVLEAIIGDLRAVGITVTPRWLEQKAAYAERAEGKMTMGLMSWGSGGVQDVFYTNVYFFEGGNDDFARDPAVIELAKAGGTMLDSDKRAEIYKKMFQRIDDQAYWVPIAIQSDFNAFSSDLDVFTKNDGWPPFFWAKWK